MARQATNASRTSWDLFVVIICARLLGPLVAWARTLVRLAVLVGAPAGVEGVVARHHGLNLTCTCHANPILKGTALGKVVRLLR